jgi:subtilisin family serine protease
VRVYQFRHIRAEGHCSRVNPAPMAAQCLPVEGLTHFFDAQAWPSGTRLGDSPLDTAGADRAHAAGAAAPKHRHVPFPPLRRGLLIVVAAAALVSAGPAQPASAPAPAVLPDRAEVIVGLAAPSLAEAIAQSRVLSSTVKQRRLDLASATSVSYVRDLDSRQRALEQRIIARIPSAQVRWRYTVVLNALAVVIPRRALGRLDPVPGIARVYPNLRYHSLLDRSPSLIGAPALWGAGLASAGQEQKIGIIDDGVDQSHPFFGAAGYTMPAGFPKGDRAYTTAKVIVARAFPPATPAWKNAAKPFDPQYSEHATHVAGIAAGNNAFAANSPDRGRVTLSGVAPKAYLGNYKVLTIPTASGVGLDGNAAEIAAGVEAAVKDGMDVINLSLGEPEIEQSRDVLVRAINAAADAGVVPAIAAGNDFDTFGRGSIGSPGTAPKAITSAAVSKTKLVASFSSSGPTPVSLALKPDVSAPGVSILSSVPQKDGLLAVFNGTSMASPHIAGAAALLRQQHPDWSVSQLKSALAQTGDPVLAEDGQAEVATTREGGGLINLVRANDPLVFVSPTNLTFGPMKPGTARTRTLRISDAGGGAGPWTVDVRSQVSAPKVHIGVPAAISVPGQLQVTATVARGAGEQEVTGFVVLTRDDQVRRIPYWLRADAPVLGREPHGTLARTGTYRGSTAGKPSRVATYRYPELRSALILRGPEQVFRVTLRKPVANFGVAILSEGNGVDVEPRVVFAGDENRLTGYSALPLNINPYLSIFGRPAPTAAAIRPARGSFDVVFDSVSRASAGRFTFRFWVGDTTPPRIVVSNPTLDSGKHLRLTIMDAGSGVDPTSLLVLIDGRSRVPSYDRSTGRATVDVSDVGSGRHELAVQVSDYQESKNMENVPPILPNTRQLKRTLTIR